MFDDARKELDSIQRAEERRMKELEKVDNLVEHLQGRRIAQREDLLPDDRVCTRCLEKKLDPQQWVVLINGQADKRWRARLSHYKQRRTAAIVAGRKPPTLRINVMCLSCYRVKPAKPVGNPFTPVIYWCVDSRLVKRRRYELDLSGAYVAESCGWSQPRQSNIESRTNYKVRHEEAVMLQRVLDLEALPVVGEHEVRYLVDNVRLRAMRQAAGASRSVVGNWFGASKERVYKLEQKPSEVCSRIVQAIVRGFVRMTSSKSDLNLPTRLD